MKFGKQSTVALLAFIAASIGACTSFDGFTFDRQREGPDDSGEVGGGGSGGGATIGSGGMGATSTGAGGGMDGAGGGMGGAGGAGICGGDHQCVAAAPPGWLGPFALYDGDPAAAPTCASPFPLPIPDGWADLESSDASCSPCNCSPPTGAGCKPDNIWLRGGLNCSSPNLGTFSFGNDGTVCQGVDSVSVASIHTWGWDRVGTCASPAAPQNPPITPTEWGRMAIGCAFPAADDGGCGAGEVCAPNPTAPLDDGGLCVAYPGHVACPASTYTSRRIFYAGVDDTRGCSQCTCNLTGTCSGTLMGYSNASCSAQVLSTTADLTCTNTTADYFKYTSSITNAQCNAGGGVATGCAIPADPITVCCTAGGSPCPEDMVEIPSPSGGSYCVDATEVTNARYAQFVVAYPPLDNQPAECAWNSSYVSTTEDWLDAPDLPVTGVDWCDAFAYCAWAGKRLCGNMGGGSNPIADADDQTQSQWYAACSRGGELSYSYGDQLKGGACNSAAGAVGTAACCTGGYWGLYDMSGNVDEWEDSCDAANGQSDSCLVRGRSNGQCAPSFQQQRMTGASDIGFRCCSP